MNRLTKFLKEEYHAKYSDGSKAKCLKYKFFDLLDPMDD